LRRGERSRRRYGSHGESLTAEGRRHWPVG
jgi:hypothetical protein